MKYIKQIIFIAIASALITGCNIRQDIGVPSQEVIQITDCVGRKVDVPSHINTIAGIDSFAGQAIIMLDQGQKMTATVGGVQRDKLLQKICPNLVNASIPKENSSLNIEELMRLNPDVIFIKGDTVRNKDEKAKLDKSGIPYVVVEYDSMEAQIEAMMIIGKTLGQEAYDEALSYEKYYSKCMETASKKSVEIKKKINLYHSINEAVRTDFPNTLSADWINVVGVNNVSVNQELRFSENNYYAGLEQIFLWNPDVIICNETGVSDYILTDIKWKGLSAVENNTVYQMPIGVSRYGHPGGIETPLAILWLGTLIYPDIYADVNLYDEMKYFYKEFYEFDMEKDLFADIMSGKGIRETSNKSKSK